MSAKSSRKSGPKTIITLPSLHYRHYTTVITLPSLHYRHYTTVITLPSLHYRHYTTVITLPSRQLEPHHAASIVCSSTFHCASCYWTFRHHSLLLVVSHSNAALFGSAIHTDYRKVKGKLHIFGDWMVLHCDSVQTHIPNSVVDAWNSTSKERRHAATCTNIYRLVNTAVHCRNIFQVVPIRF